MKGGVFFAALLLSSGAVAAAALIPLGPVLLAFFLGVLLYLVLCRNRTREAWSGIGVQLKPRSSLIPIWARACADTPIAGAPSFRRRRRRAAHSPKAVTPAAAAVADQGLTAAIGRLVAVAVGGLHSMSCRAI
jgi:LemA protein